MGAKYENGKVWPVAHGHPPRRVLPALNQLVGGPDRPRRVAAVPARKGRTVVGTLVLCSVHDQATSLAEIKRVLRPGGKFVLMEHVRSDDPEMAARQDKAEPRQVRFGGGCHPNRPTLSAIVAAGFETDGVEHREFPGSKLTKAAIFGVARKPASGSPAVGLDRDPVD